MRTKRLYHGGVRDLKRGDVILPNMAEHRYVEGCPHCEAQRLADRGEEVDLPCDPPTPPDWVYATTHRLYARYYASRAVEGDLYKVDLRIDVERSTEDQFPTGRGREAVVVRVIERRITLTMKERRHLYRLWGGTDAEFETLFLETGRNLGREEVARQLLDL